MAQQVFLSLPCILLSSLSLSLASVSVDAYASQFSARVSCRLKSGCTHNSFRTPRRLCMIRQEKAASSIYSSKEGEDEKRIGMEIEAQKNRRTGQAKRRLEKAVRREDRIAILQQQMLRNNKNDDNNNNSSSSITHSERQELKGLLETRQTFEEQYNAESFTEKHLQFKATHNDAFIALGRYCERERDRILLRKSDYSSNRPKESIQLFYLDGPDGGTTSALLDRGGFDPSQCYVANRHECSCDALRRSGGGRLPEENVVLATAAEALSICRDDIADNGKRINGSPTPVDAAGCGSLSDIPFTAYYFDGCGGFIPHIIGMMSSALIRDEKGDNGNDVVCSTTRSNDSEKRSNSSALPIAIGYSLMGGNKDVVDKELKISQALTSIAKRRNMRVVQVLGECHDTTFVFRTVQ